ncbi:MULTISPECIES: dicarboxylate/amino acid:cation symporter [Shewanella]|jgi:Na+/H+-dicarboxylate symporter|uniref:Cation:dicarboxylase symporter family transporter n=1 Tax=Shewanella chilikensis TaxID=558541 RepID=A0A6G7LP07_9GAMM|nr:MULTISPECIES: dicarboxylate/amino acid:cation symporter [Shewanella]MBO2644278.1 dicarboxylate/amino acid:cation symporter [Shewanella algae]MBZ4677372.1 dicarboxylate/amino acid:cation symporter [Shewanella sp.]MCA0951292.1 dicarboxylate/amino acid:cation symporter [Shewanella chilikensis]MCE9852924.1 dicarboxylate/amino acid:cation symporter [Shewanella chilikensis]MCL1153130.1 dicarboxylate/amino acid:cation symporter [Shewanella chilikensis]
MNNKHWIGNIGVQVVIAMFLGAAVGWWFGEDASMFAPLGTIFIHLIKMLVIPLVLVAIISGAASLGDTPSAGKIGLGTFGFFIVTSGIAVTLALVLGNLFQPGKGVDFTAHSMTDLMEVTKEQGDLPGVMDTFIGMIPTNVFESLTGGNILQILVFSIFFGIALTKVKGDGAKPILGALNAITEAMVWMINCVMLVAPIGVFGLMADSVGTFGFDALEVVFKLFIVFVGAILIYGFIFFPLMVQLFSKVSAARFISAMKKPQVMALSTASSMATLPVNMETCEQELKVSKATASFVLPLGATINMSGNAIYYGLVAMFFAQMYNIDLSLAAYAAIIFTSTLGAIGQAGVPGPSFLVVAVLLAAKIPIDGLPLLFALDRVFDMIRTSLNITGDAACALVMDNFCPEEAKS